MTEDEYRENPEFLYNLRGVFDEFSYEDDLEHFPEYFDENGWPLFGIYDPYTLKHPITGVSWHLASRVPTNDEADPDYEAWFELAQQYESTLNKIIGHQHKSPLNPQTDPVNDTANVHVLYNSGHKYAVAGNLKYLKECILPYIEDDLKNRTLSPQFTSTWGEFRLIGENLETSFKIETRRYQGQIGGKKNKADRNPQLKWYLHWHRHQVETLGQTKKKADENFVTLAWRLYNEDIPLPNGFEKEWFSKALGRGNKQEGSQTVTRKRPDKLLRAFKNQVLVNQLLAATASETPKIPPVDPQFYEKLVGAPGPHKPK